MLIYLNDINSFHRKYNHAGKILDLLTNSFIIVWIVKKIVVFRKLKAKLVLYALSLKWNQNVLVISSVWLPIFQSGVF